MRIKIHVWRQSDRTDRGQMKSYDLEGLSPDMSLVKLTAQKPKPRLVSCTCGTSMTERRFSSSHGELVRSRLFATLWWIGQRLTASFKRAVSSVTTLAPNPNRTRFRSSRAFPKLPWMLPVASAVVHVWPLVRLTWACFRKDKPSDLIELKTWLTRWRPKASAAAGTTPSAKLSARKGLASPLLGV